eukprot:gene27590-7225_t
MDIARTALPCRFPLRKLTTDIAHRHLEPLGQQLRTTRRASDSFRRLAADEEGSSGWAWGGGGDSDSKVSRGRRSDDYDSEDSGGRERERKPQRGGRGEASRGGGGPSGRWGTDSGGFKGQGGGGYGNRWEDESREKLPNVRDDVQGQVIYGVFPVLNALENGRRKPYALNVLESLDLKKRKDAGAVKKIFKLAQELAVPVVKLSRLDLNLLSDDKPHQGFVLDGSDLGWSHKDKFEPAEKAMADNNGVPPVWVALDEVTDPMNLGAIIRSSFCLGATGVLGCAKNSAPLNAVVSKASAGAMEVMQLYSTGNLPSLLQDAVASGWQVFGAAAGPEAVECRDCVVDKPTILVMGSESVGLRTNVRRSCTGMIKIEMGDAKDAQSVDSLNVSVAAGILLHQLVGSAKRSSSTSHVVTPAAAISVGAPSE